MKESIAVIMTVHNRKDTTIECIRRFYACKGIEDFDIEFYMMDDGSTDGTSDAVAIAFPQVIIMHGDGNLFWNRGMYHCWKEAIKKHHDYYLWLNDDTMLFENALKIIFTDYVVAGVMSIISGSCCDTKTHSVTTYGGWIGSSVAEMNGTLREIEKMNGNCVLIPNEIVEKIGILDPYFLHSAGDNEYGYRAQRNGITTFITSAFIGTCDRHDRLWKSMDPDLTVWERLKYLNTPWGAMPKEKFYLNRKYRSIWIAVYYYLRDYYRCFVPRKK